MNLSWIDLLIPLALFCIVITAAAATRRYNNSVADFLAANRCAGRYLLCVAGGMGNLGAVSIVAYFELYWNAGFTAAWWTMMLTPLSLILAISGWLIYRYRETRALTLAQFFEMRYSRNFRVFAGMLAWLAGVINFGVFPAVGARFLMYFIGLPRYPVTLVGTEVSLTFAGIMAASLAVSLMLVFWSGQISVIVTDFIQGVFTNIAFLIILIYLLTTLSWSDITATLVQAPENASRIHPFHTSQVDDFNYFYFLIGMVTSIYTFRLAWQGSQAFNCSAKSPHEAKMATILGEWRGLVTLLVVMMLPIGAYFIMHNPTYSAIAASVTKTLDQMPSQQMREEMVVSVTLAKSLPIGIAGLLCAVLIAAFIATNNSYLHSWGSIFVQDVILPLRSEPFSAAQHIRVLRGSIAFVAVFAFFFSLLFQQTESILLFFSISGAIFLGGAGAAIIGGLYWKRGSTGGAWGALISGAVVALGSLAARQAWPGTVYPCLQSHAPAFLSSLNAGLEGVSSAVPGINWSVTPEEFPIDSQWMFLFTILTACGVYITISLFASLVLRRPVANLDALLHRGEYAEQIGAEEEYVRPPTGWRTLLPSDEFTLGDRAIYFSQLGWTIGWFAVFVIGTAYNLLYTVSDESWATFWWWYVCISFALGAFTTVWFTVGGVVDLQSMCRALERGRTLQQSRLDDGTVVGTFSEVAT